MTGIEEAIQLAGGQEALAFMFEPPITQQAVSVMKARGYAPVIRAHQIRRWYPQIALDRLIAPGE